MKRRDFLKKTSIAAAAVAAPAIIPAKVLGRNGQVLPSNKITMACIGVGWQGTGNMENFLRESDCQVVAVCDVEKGSNLYYGQGSYGLEPAREKVEKYYSEQARFLGVGGCEVYGDFRRLLERKDIDAVTVCTPDHWHAVISILAAKADKDIYCEAPLANSVL